MDPATLALFAGALALAAGSPGPSIAALVARTIARGWRDVLPFLAAMWVGEVMWLMAALAGLSALAQTFHGVFVVLKWAGVAYLIYLAVQMWRAPVAQAGALPPPAAPWAMFGAGMALTLGNPKIMVFYVALLPVLIDVPSVTVGDAVALAVTCVVVLAAVDLAWTCAAHRARAWLRSPRAVRIANRISATALGGAAAAVAARG